MASFGNSSLLTTMQGQMSALLIGEKSLFTPKFWERAGIQWFDDNALYTPVGNQTPTWGQTIRFVLSKRASRLGDVLIEWTLSKAGNAAGDRGAYIINAGDAICKRVTMRYANNVLHSFPGEAQQIYRRVTKHEIMEEGRDSLTLGNLRGSIPADEAQREIAFWSGAVGGNANAFVLYSPLDELWFRHHFDEYWTPSAFATEAELEIEIAPLGEICYTNTGVAPITPPTITSVRLRQRELTLTTQETAQLKQLYRTEQGLLVHFLDTETQLRTSFTGNGGAASRELRVPLDNIRLDMFALFFVVRPSANTGVSVNNPYSGDRLDSSDPINVSSVTGTDTGMFQPITSFRLEANGQRVTNDIPELLNRGYMRQLYWKDAQVRDYIYSLCFAALGDNRKHVTGFLNAANLGKLELVITMNDFGAGVREVDVFALSHNLIQMRMGDAIKTLK